MNISEKTFLEQLTKITETTSQLNFETSLSSNEIFDSLSLMSIAAWISDNFNKNIKVSDLEKLSDLRQLYILISE